MTRSQPALVVANWKMNPSSGTEVRLLMKALEQKIATGSNVTLPTLAIAPSFVHLGLVGHYLTHLPIGLVAQNVCAQNASHGAFTGEVSAKQLADIQVQSVIIGHSERRQYFDESDEVLTQKTHNALTQGLSIIFCVGETLGQYESQQTQSVIAEQLKVLLPFLKTEFAQKIIIAYEPIWAIGTGKVPTVVEVTQVHQYIVDTLATHNQAFAKTPILYGGSVKAGNAVDFAQSPTISGVLVGGAALDLNSFWQIITAFSNK